jgi:molybdopterin molybdotransferase
MISVQLAEATILAEIQHFGEELVPLSTSLGRVLAEALYADRDFPPFHRVAMDGIAIDYQAIENNIQRFTSVGVQAAGAKVISIAQIDECVEIMTGAALPAHCDTVIRYESLTRDGAHHFLLNTDAITKGQNVHKKGKDKRKGDLLVPENELIGSAIIQIAASIGKTHLLVKKLPKIAVVSTGDELVELDVQPNETQIRRSNVYAVQALLSKFHCPITLFHLNDDFDLLEKELQFYCTKFDVIILSGGISAGKFDYIPEALSKIGVAQKLHKVAQRPGKPFYFGTWKGADSSKQVTIFGLPGNPLSTMLCFRRYVQLWLEKSLCLPTENVEAILEETVTFEPNLQYFIPVQLVNQAATLRAKPLKNNGSGDFAALIAADGFMELPASSTQFLQNEIYKVWLI